MAFTPTLQYFTDSTGQVWTIQVNSDGTMTTTQVGSTPSPGSGLYNTTAGSIITSVEGDVQNTTNNTAQLLDYVDRVCKRILRESQWQFLKSQTPMRFITQPGVTNYWIANGTAPTGSVNTGLALTDLWSIDPNSVWDRSNYRQLSPNSSSVNFSSPNLSYPDSNPRLGHPRAYQYHISYPGLFSIFPAPDNQSGYQPVPQPPICTITAAGALPARTYYVVATFVDQQGNESTPSVNPTIIFIPEGYILNAAAPIAEVASASQTSYGQWNIYVSESNSTNAELQNASPLTGAFVEPTSGLISGVEPPSSNALVPLYGYIVEFTYYMLRQTVTNVGQILQVPDVYRDVVVAGVTYYAQMYLDRDPELMKANAWKQEFLDGLRQIRKDLNISFRSTDFIAPDSASQLSYTNGLDMYGPSIGEI